ncbi:MAG: type VI secretion system-associated protein TagF [Azoarcus sp.]|jgi:type VI secretion system protein ImpM|nr:type VI secretion system-associated protein TagF [Azoarcus sp.]
MPITFLPVRDGTPRYTVFGKLPRRADFVRVEAGCPVAVEFDELLGKSLALAAGRIAPDAGTSDFQITSRDGRWCLIGVLTPSRDEAGRIYPLVAGIVLPAQAIVPCAPELAIANELFFSSLAEQLASAVENAVDLVACRQFLETWIAPNPHVGDDIELASRLLTRHLARTSAADWHAALLDAGAGGIDDKLLAIIFSESRAAGHPVFLPLSETPGEDRLDQAAWLALCRAALGNGRSPDFVLVRRAQRRHLAVSTGRLDGKFLAAALWGESPGAQEIASEAPERRHPAHAALAFSLARQLQDPALTLAALETTLGRFALDVAAAPPRKPAFSFSFAD